MYPLYPLTMNLQRPYGYNIYALLTGDVSSALDSQLVLRQCCAGNAANKADRAKTKRHVSLVLISFDCQKMTADNEGNDAD